MTPFMILGLILTYRGHDAGGARRGEDPECQKFLGCTLASAIEACTKGLSCSFCEQLEELQELLNGVPSTDLHPLPPAQCRADTSSTRGDPDDDDSDDEDDGFLDRGGGRRSQSGSSLGSASSNGRSRNSSKNGGGFQSRSASRTMSGDASRDAFSNGRRSRSGGGSQSLEASRSVSGEFSQEGGGSRDASSNGRSRNSSRSGGGSESRSTSRTMSGDASRDAFSNGRRSRSGGGSQSLEASRSVSGEFSQEGGGSSGSRSRSMSIDDIRSFRDAESSAGIEALLSSRSESSVGGPGEETGSLSTGRPGSIKEIQRKGSHLKPLKGECAGDIYVNLRGRDNYLPIISDVNFVPNTLNMNQDQLNAAYKAWSSGDGPDIITFSGNPKHYEFKGKEWVLKKEFKEPVLYTVDFKLGVQHNFKTTKKDEKRERALKCGK
eukprot:TRINITY_DN4165_c0_g1_i1.p1 TRINITY_DN4165_c0_g1~~TRINITY_DN4165_c0_g1_i1.p1  ORF type:complete len:436 (-),score=46.86 TRINITY_DN4165_c0_g1_i1:60-1367(-)